MITYQSFISELIGKIKANGNKEITGPILQDVISKLASSVPFFLSNKAYLGFRSHDPGFQYSETTVPTFLKNGGLWLVNPGETLSGTFDPAKCTNLLDGLSDTSEYSDFEDYQNATVYDNAEQNKVTYNFRFFFYINENPSAGNLPLLENGDVNTTYWREAEVAKKNGHPWSAGLYKQYQTILENDKYYYLTVDTSVNSFESTDFTTELGEGKWKVLGAESTFTADIPVMLDSGESFGKFVNGDIIPAKGLTGQQVVTLAVQKYLSPEFSLFNISGLPSTVEVGTVLTGVYTFVWGVNNLENVKPNSISIEDVTGSEVLVDNSSNDGTEDIDLTGVTFSTEGNRTWRIELENTHDVTANRSKSVPASFLLFYGSTDSIPASSAEVRGLPFSRFNNQGNVFIHNTGDSEVNHVVCVEEGKSITNVTDLDALNANITSSYVNTGLVLVADAGDNDRNYKVYTMTQGVPYSENHRHQITIA